MHFDRQFRKWPSGLGRRTNCTQVPPWLGLHAAHFDIIRRNLIYVDYSNHILFSVFCAFLGNLHRLGLWFEPRDHSEDRPIE